MDVGGAGLDPSASATASLTPSAAEAPYAACEEEDFMDPSNLVGLVVLIVVVYLAFRIGAFLMKGLLGLLAIAIVVWLVMRLVGGEEVLPEAMAVVGGLGAV